jgi:transposase-like protein
MTQKETNCPKCFSESIVKSGIVNNRQRYTCKTCRYNFSVQKLGKEIDNYFVVKGLQLYLEGVSYREIERILGISHVTVSNWVKKFGVKKPVNTAYHPSYKIITHNELIEYLQKKENVLGKGMIITEVGDKFMLIKWDRFKK